MSHVSDLLQSPPLSSILIYCVPDDWRPPVRIICEQSKPPLFAHREADVVFSCSLKEENHDFLPTSHL